MYSTYFSFLVFFEMWDLSFSKHVQCISYFLIFAAFTPLVNSVLPGGAFELFRVSASSQHFEMLPYLVSPFCRP